MTDPDQQPVTDQAPVPAKKSRLGLILAGVGVLVVGILAAALILPRLSDAESPPVAAATSRATASTAPKTLAVRGSLRLGLGDFTWSEKGRVGQQGSWCAGDGGYDDIALGAPVSITDASGTVIGLGKLDVSILADRSDDDTPTACELRFNVVGVPAGKSFYGVEVSHRGVVKFDEAALTEPVELTLG